MLNNNRLSVIFMTLHALLVIVWNIAGLWLISQGKSALGPTASLVGVILFAVLIGLYIIFYKKKYKKLFLIFVLIGASLGSMAIYGALTKDHNLWPSEFWRYAGIAVNTLGVIGFVLAIIPRSINNKLNN